MNQYKKAITQEMTKLGKLKNSLFLGQQVGVTDFYGTLKNVPLSKRMEMPVAEEMQLGMSMGFALDGFLPISIYQRIDFLPRACDQLINHLDIIKELSKGRFNPKVIIRTTVGSKKPLDTGLQHSKDLVEGFIKILSNILVIGVKTPKEVSEAYTHAKYDKGSTMIVEYQDLYE